MSLYNHYSLQPADAIISHSDLDLICPVGGKISLPHLTDALRRSADSDPLNYPPKQIRDRIAHIYTNLYTGTTTLYTHDPSNPNPPRGVFCRRGYKSGDVVMVYSGRTTQTLNDYTVTVRSSSPTHTSLTIDGTPSDDPFTISGNINEDLRLLDPKLNSLTFCPYGVICATRDIRPGELSIAYGEDYNWDTLKCHFIKFLANSLLTLSTILLPSQSQADLVPLVAAILQWSPSDLRNARDDPPLGSIIMSACDGLFDQSMHNIFPSALINEPLHFWIERVLRCQPLTTQLSFRRWTPTNTLNTISLLPTQQPCSTSESGAVTTRDLPRRSNRIADPKYTAPTYTDSGLYDSEGLPNLTSPLMTLIPLTVANAPSTCNIFSSNYGSTSSSTSTSSKRQRILLCDTDCDPILPLLPPLLPSCASHLLPPSVPHTLSLNPAPYTNAHLLLPSTTHTPTPTQPDSMDPLNLSQSPHSSPTLPPICGNELRVLFWNCNQLSSTLQENQVNSTSRVKLNHILDTIRNLRLDCVFLIDTRLPITSLNGTKHYIHSRLNNSYRVHIAPTVGVGGQLVILSSRLTNVRFESLHDHGSLLSTTFFLGSSQVEVLSSYWPYPYSTRVPPNSFWAKLGKGTNPMPTLRAITAKRLRQAISENRAIIFALDANSDIFRRDSDRNNLANFLATQQLSNASSTPSAPTYANTSTIDYVFYNSRGPIAPCKSSFVLDTYWSDPLDHLPLLARFSVIGTPVKQPRVTRLKLPVDVPASDAKTKAKLKLIFEDLVVDPMLPADKLLESIGDQCVATTQLLCYRPKRWFNGWSPSVIAVIHNLREVHVMRRHITGSHGYTLWQTPTQYSRGMRVIRKRWLQSLRRLAKDPSQLSSFRSEGVRSFNYYMASDRRPLFQSMTAASLTDDIRIIRQNLHGVDRKQARIESGERQAAMVRAADAGRTKSAIRYVTGQSTPSFSPETITIDGTVITDASQIASILRDRQRTIFDFDSNALPGTISAPGASWADLHNQTFDQFQTRYASMNIPFEPMHILWRAICFQRGSQSARDVFAATCMTPPTYDEFCASIDASPVNKAPGISGLTNNMIKLWPPRVRLATYNAILSLFNRDTPSSPAYWKWKYLVLLPKVFNPSLDDLRPIILMEALRKIWESIFIRRKMRYLEENDVLSPSQHAYQRRRGTDSATVQLINAIETANVRNTDLFICSIDAKGAFDNPSFPAQLYASIRVGIPFAFASYLQDLDNDARVLVRTPHIVNRVREGGWRSAEGWSFTPHKGYSQGGPGSGTGFCEFDDILLTALEIANNDSDAFYTIDAASNIKKTPDIGFSDDTLSLTGTHRGTQLKTDVLCAFYAVFGNTFSTTTGPNNTVLVKKAKAYHLMCGNDKSSTTTPTTILLHTNRWLPLPLTLISQGSLKFLGVLHQLDGNSADMYTSVHDQLQKVLPIIATRRINADIKYMAIRDSVYQSLLYRAKFAAWSLASYQTLDTFLSNLLNSLNLNPRAAPRKLLYIKGAGYGYTLLSSRAQLLKHKLTLTCLAGDLNTRHAMSGIIHRGFLAGGSYPYPNLRTSARPPTLIDTPTFTRSLFEWYTQLGLSIRCKGAPANAVNTLIIDSIALTSTQIAQLESLGIATMGELMVSTDPVNTLQTMDITLCTELVFPPPQPLQLRVGQVWLLQDDPPDTALEIVGFKDDTDVLTLQWHSHDGTQILPRTTLVLPAYRYPRGACDPSSSHPITSFCMLAYQLVTTTNDSPIIDALTSTVLVIRPRTATYSVPLPYIAPVLPPPIHHPTLSSTTVFTSCAVSTPLPLPQLLAASSAPATGVLLLRDDSSSNSIIIHGSSSSSAHSVELSGLTLALLWAPHLVAQSGKAAESLVTAIQRKAASSPLNFLSLPLRLRPCNIVKTSTLVNKRIKPHLLTPTQLLIRDAKLIAAGSTPLVPTTVLAHLSDSVILLPLASYSPFSLWTGDNIFHSDIEKLEQSQLLHTYSSRRTSLNNSTVGFAQAISKRCNDFTRRGGRRGLRQLVWMWWDKHAHGFNLAKWSNFNVQALCRHCLTNNDETQSHIIRECTHSSLVSIRTATLQEALTFCQPLILSNDPLGIIAERYITMATSVDDPPTYGERLWTGMLTPSQVEYLSTVPPGTDPLKAYNLYKKIGTILSNGASQIYRHRAMLISQSRMRPDNSPSHSNVNHAIMSIASRRARRRKSQQLPPPSRTLAAPRLLLSPACTSHTSNTEASTPNPSLLPPPTTTIGPISTATHSTTTLAPHHCCTRVNMQLSSETDIPTHHWQHPIHARLPPRDILFCCCLQKMVNLHTSSVFYVPQDGHQLLHAILESIPIERTATDVFTLRRALITHMEESSEGSQILHSWHRSSGLTKRVFDTQSLHNAVVPLKTIPYLANILSVDICVYSPEHQEVFHHQSTDTTVRRMIPIGVDHLTGHCYATRPLSDSTCQFMTFLQTKLSSMDSDLRVRYVPSDSHCLIHAILTSLNTPRTENDVFTIRDTLASTIRASETIRDQYMQSVFLADHVPFSDYIRALRNMAYLDDLCISVLADIIHTTIIVHTYTGQIDFKPANPHPTPTTIHIGFHSNHYYATFNRTFSIHPCPITDTDYPIPNFHNTYDSDTDDDPSNTPPADLLISHTAFSPPTMITTPTIADLLHAIPNSTTNSLKRRPSIAVNNNIVDIDTITRPLKRQRQIREYFTPIPTNLPYSYKKPKDRPG